MCLLRVGLVLNRFLMIFGKEGRVFCAHLHIKSGKCALICILPAGCAHLHISVGMRSCSDWCSAFGGVASHGE